MDNGGGGVRGRTPLPLRHYAAAIPRAAFIQRPTASRTRHVHRLRHGQLCWTEAAARGTTEKTHWIFGVRVAERADQAVEFFRRQPAKSGISGYKKTRQFAAVRESSIVEDTQIIRAILGSGT